jgi:hypothetical protein
MMPLLIRWRFVENSLWTEFDLFVIRGASRLVAHFFFVLSAQALSVAKASPLDAG